MPISTMTSRFRTHICNWPDCRRPVPRDMWGCGSHWFSLPLEIRQEISMAWRLKPGLASAEWLKANEDALEWIRGLPERIAAMNVGRNTPVPGHKESSDVDSDPPAG